MIIRIDRAGGFTLVELLVTLSIAAILLMLAVPSFQALALDGRRTSLANDLVLALTYAKSEAVKRGVPVTVCSRATDTACADSTDWDKGWLVFADPGKNGSVDASDLILQVYPDLPNNNTLRAATRNFFTFQSTGFVGDANRGTLRLCDARGTTEGRGIVISALGRVKIAPLASGLTCP